MASALALGLAIYAVIDSKKTGDEHDRMWAIGGIAIGGLVLLGTLANLAQLITG